RLELSSERGVPEQSADAVRRWPFLLGLGPERAEPLEQGRPHCRDLAAWWNVQLVEVFEDDIQIRQHLRFDSKAAEEIREAAEVPFALYPNDRNPTLLKIPA